MQHFLGALKSKIDTRDYRIAATANEYPKTYSCSDLPPIKNQRNVSSCVAHATATILETFNKKETGKFISLSTNFIYGMQGIALGRSESGMYLRDACKIVKDYGDPSEASIGGNTEQPICTENLRGKLSDKVYSEARIFKVKSYARCKTENDIKHALLNYGPVLASIKWYNKYSLNKKIINFDKNSEYGYHAVMIYGWDEEGWLCQNSWGKDWNNGGKFIYPFSESFAETWSFVDAINDDVYKPLAADSWLKYIYKFINFILNLFKKKD